MEKNRAGQVIAIVALVVGVVGLSIGFAAFSNTLKIQSSATVKADPTTFNVDFSSSNTELLTNNIVPTKYPDNVTDFIATEAKIDNSGDPTISNLSATFTEPGQVVTYDFYAYNIGELTAYLKSIVYSNVTGGSSTKVCTAGEDTDADLVAKACEGISLSVKVGSEEETTSGIASISGHSLLKDASELVTVKLSYSSEASRADGDFTVAFGDVSLNYSSVDK
jgi:hypothetical protein